MRGDFFRLTKREAKQKLGMDDGKPLIVSFFGSLGAAEMNREMAQFLALEVKNGAPFHHVHGAGAVGYRRSYNFRPLLSFSSTITAPPASASTRALDS